MKMKTEKGNTLAFVLLVVFGVIGVCIAGVKSTGGLSYLFGGSPKAEATEVRQREFPMMKVPEAISDREERISWLSENFWNAFTRTGEDYACDTALVAGVPKVEVEEALGTWVALIEALPLEEGRKAVRLFYDKIAATERADTASNVFESLVELASRYLYDPNSPVRNEDLYLPLVERLSESELIDEGYHASYGFDARMCVLNQCGMVAADFAIQTLDGKRLRLHDVKAGHTLLFFSNPGCPACAEIIAELEGDDHVAELLSSGRLAVVNVYIDQDLNDWREYAVNYPASWISGYNYDYEIRMNLTYSVRAIPSLYLLGEDKAVLLKDAPVDKVMKALDGIQ